ncbi:hypothetical protein GQ54DRAFT_296829 [Martensiomyces pterosporus]|nr:hypothetical protein GQ54DRAFT_296829 [Martensiomyces pterosporus]
MTCRHLLPWSLHLALLVALLACSVNGARVVHDWDVGYVIVNRDGYTTRRAIGVNGKLPIPPITLTVGDTLVMNVHNSLDVPTSIHSHGLFHNGTSFLDGAAMVTQCGIPPGESFTYEYVVAQTGTYWMHGHNLHQNSDGLRTPLIVYDHGKPPFEYDEEFVFALEDWYAVEVKDRINMTIAPFATFPPPPSFPYALINGYNGNLTKPIQFKPGRTYRIRIVNMSTTEWFKFNMPGHQLQVIEADGIYSDPLAVDGLDLSPGQRYSVLVTAHNTDAVNHQYNITLYASFIPNTPGKSPRSYQGLVEYRQGAPIKNVTVDYSNFLWADDSRLSALDQEPALPVDRKIEISVSGTLYKNGQNLDFVNNMTYAQPLIPSLFTAFTMGDLATNATVYGPQTNAIVLKHLEVVEIVISNPNSLPHPLHLHGHAFQIIEYGPFNMVYPPNTTVPKLRTYSGAPMRRDTLLVHSLEYLKIRLRADNPGVWLLHCHMDIHFAMGMVVTFVEAPDVLQKRQRVPDKLITQCQQQGIKTSGNGAGNQGFDFSGLQTPPQMVATPTLVYAGV